MAKLAVFDHYVGVRVGLQPSGYHPSQIRSIRRALVGRTLKDREGLLGSQLPGDPGSPHSNPITM